MKEKPIKLKYIQLVSGAVICYNYNEMTPLETIHTIEIDRGQIKIDNRTEDVEDIEINRSHIVCTWIN